MAPGTASLGVVVEELCDAGGACGALLGGVVALVAREEAALVWESMRTYLDGQWEPAARFALAERQRREAKRLKAELSYEKALNGSAAKGIASDTAGRGVVPGAGAAVFRVSLNAQQFTAPIDGGFAWYLEPRITRITQLGTRRSILCSSRPSAATTT